MDNILPTETFTEVEGRGYLNPQVALDESNAFIDNLRATQAQQNQQIAQQTRNLGTDVPSNLGGLTGAGSYFTSRYQVPQTASAVANLRATAQAAALNQALQNEQEIWKKKYNDAYRKYQKSAYNKANSGNGLSGVTNGGIDQTDPSLLSSYEWGEGDPVTFEGDTGIRAGWGDWNDLFTGKYNFTLPGGRQLELGGNNEELRYGSDGNYYIHNKANNTYYKITGAEGNNSAAGGESRWWTNGNATQSGRVNGYSGGGSGGGGGGSWGYYGR